MSVPQPIDLRFGDVERQIGSYLIDSPHGPLLYDCGPTSTLPRLREGEFHPLFFKPGLLEVLLNLSQVPDAFT